MVLHNAGLSDLFAAAVVMRSFGLHLGSTERAHMPGVRGGGRAQWQRLHCSDSAVAASKCCLHCTLARPQTLKALSRMRQALLGGGQLEALTVATGQLAAAAASAPLARNVSSEMAAKVNNLMAQISGAWA